MFFNKNFMQLLLLFTISTTSVFAQLEPKKATADETAAKAVENDAQPEAVANVNEVPGQVGEAAAANLTAKQVIETFQNSLLETMKQGKELGFHGRYKKLTPVVQNSHDLTKIARIVIGKEWKNLSIEQKQQMVDIFTRLSIASYAYNFKDFSGESFSFESEEETPRGGIIIHTFLVLPNEKDVKFDYMMKNKGESWRIINIIANGVSDLALKRSEYTSILKREGFDVLLAKISSKIDKYSQQ